MYCSYNLSIYLYYTLNPVPFLSTCHTCIHFFPAQIWLPFLAFFPPRWTLFPVTWLRRSRWFILLFCSLLLCPAFLRLKTAPPLLSSEPKTPSFFFLLQLFFVRSETPPVFCFCGFCNRCCTYIYSIFCCCDSVIISCASTISSTVSTNFPISFNLIFL